MILVDREWQERRDLLGYTVDELRTLVQEGLESGESRHHSVTEIKAEARRRPGSDQASPGNTGMGRLHLSRSLLDRTALGTLWVDAAELGSLAA